MPGIVLAEEFREALQLLAGGKHVFLTGKAGTGKSTLVRRFMAETERNVVVVAPTGIAALNVDGYTIHRMFGFRSTTTLDDVRRGEYYKYSGTIPMSMSPFAVANIGAVFLELTQMCKSIPAEAPWDAPKADKWDQLTWSKWLDGNTLSKPARTLLDASIAGLYTSAASEISLLFVLYQMASAGGPSFVLGVKDAAEDARPVGGMEAIHRAIAAELGDVVALSQPVRSITQDADGVTVRSEDMVVRARRVVVAVPISIASHIIYEPMLPVDRSFLHQRMPGGAVFKIAMVYDEPWWRADGLSGQSFRPGSSANLTIDSCTDNPTPGILTASPRDPRRAGSARSPRPSDVRRCCRRSPNDSATGPCPPSTTSSRTGPSSAIRAAG